MTLAKMVIRTQNSQQMNWSEWAQEKKNMKELVTVTVEAYEWERWVEAPEGGSTISTILTVRAPSMSQCGYLNVSYWYQGSWEADSSNYLWISHPTRSGFTHLASAIMVCVTCYMSPQHRLMGRVTGETLTRFLLTYAWSRKVTWPKVYRWVAF